jgi:hypothetical protein
MNNNEVFATFEAFSEDDKKYALYLCKKMRFAKFYMQFIPFACIILSWGTRFVLFLDNHGLLTVLFLH